MTYASIILPYSLKKNEINENPKTKFNIIVKIKSGGLYGAKSRRSTKQAW